MPDRFFAFKNLLGTPDNHEGSEINGNKTIDHHRENSGDKEKSIRLRRIRKTFFIFIAVAFVG